MTSFARSRLSLALVCALAAMPAMAQKLSLAERVAALEQQSASQGSSAGQANVELLNRLTQMQTEVQALRNQVEQLQNDNEQLKQRNRDQYVDLDTRLQKMEAGGGSVPAGSGAANVPPVVGPSRPATGTASAGRPTASAPAAAPADVAGDEQSAYSSAFDALKRSDYVASARGFQAYLHAFPQGSLAPNAWYWLGESYYVTQNYPVALQSFESLLEQFPDSAKAPDALLKKGYCQIEMDQVGAGQQTLNRVINDYPGTDAARLAVSRLRALSLEAH
jgi:tol-pal system protein YbgF